MKTTDCPHCEGTGMRYAGLINDEDQYNRCQCDDGKVTIVRVVNFSHPLTEEDRGRIAAEAESRIREWKSRGLAQSRASVVQVEETLVPCQFDMDTDVMMQAHELARSAFDADLVVPPALGAAAFALGAITAKENPPSPVGFIVTRRREGVMPPAYEIGQIVW